MRYLYLLLFPLLAAGQFRPGAITMADGSKISCLLEVPEPDDRRLRFRTSDGEPIQKLDLEQISAFEVRDNWVITKYKVLTLAGIRRNDISTLKFAKRKSWWKVVKEGKVTLLSLFIYEPGYVSGPFKGSVSSYSYTYYAFQREGEDYAIYFITEFPGRQGENFRRNFYNKMLFPMTKALFGEKCPELLQAMTQDVMLSNPSLWIATYYNAHCGN